MKKVRSNFLQPKSKHVHDGNCGHLHTEPKNAEVEQSSQTETKDQADQQQQ